MPRKKPEIKPIQAKRLKQCREKANLTQETVANHLHVSVQMVRNWENERRPIPDYVFRGYSELTGANTGYLEGLTSIETAAAWDEFDSPGLAEQVRQSRALDTYIRTIGFNIEQEKVSDEEFNTVFTSKDGAVSRFNMDERNQLNSEIEDFVTFKIKRKDEHSNEK